MTRVYPLAFLGDDPRFNFGLLHGVAKAIEAAGYPAVTNGVDLIDLQRALFRFLHADEDVPAAVVTAVKDLYAERAARLLDEDQPLAARGHGQDDTDGQASR